MLARAPSRTALERKGKDSVWATDGGTDYGWGGHKAMQRRRFSEHWFRAPFEFVFGLGDAHCSVMCVTRGL
jgi:hypothetical protein